MKKLLFVSPDYGYFPLSAAYVFPTLRRAQIAYEFHDMHVREDLEERLLSDKFWGVATTGLVLDFNKVSEVLNLAKSIAPELTTILGGRISYSPKHLLEQLLADYVVVGEAEGTMPELVNAIQSGADDFSQIKSIMYRDENNHLVSTPKRKIPSLDNFTPHWGDIDMEHYISTDMPRNLWANSYPIVTGMGCVGKCSFCLPGIRGVRVRPVESVLQEMQEAYEKYDFSFFAFRSEVFYSRYDDVKAFCEGYKATGIGLPWVCSMRVDFDTKLLPMMAEANARYVFIGLESFDDDALKGMGKNTSEEQIDNFISSAQECGIDIIAGLMSGNMGDSPEALIKTIDYVNRKGVIAPSISPLCIYPGTQVYDKAIKEGLIKDEKAYCNSIFNENWETTYFGPLYPNVTDYPMKDWWEAYHKCRFDLETHVAIPLQSKGYDLKNGTTNCHNCGAPIQVVRGSVKAHVCKHCVTMNMVNIYLCFLKEEEIFPKIRQAMLTGKRVAVMGGVNYMKALLFVATELGVAPDNMRIVGKGTELNASIPKIDLIDVTPDDMLFLGGLHQPQKVKKYLVERGIPADNILNITLQKGKQWLKHAVEEEGAIFDFTCKEDIEFFGETIADHLATKYGKKTQWSILPAGEFGLAIYKGFMNKKMSVAAIGDSYKTASSLNLDIPVVHPAAISTTNAEKALICTPVPKVQEILRDVLLDHGNMKPEDIILLQTIYSNLWDSLLLS
ncbi:MAG: B12-binding domain-containing radical SAM protein [Pseudodesulfovibrio sp.]|nr:B12-binding domain-containing radical SAM protein [Pseudodesulfovibrio sp.]